MPRILPGAAFGAVVCAVLGMSGGCVTRPVAATHPITNTNFISSIQQTSIDKVDLLFDIDNSASMGDKQSYLARAIPDLLTRLVTPNCVDDNKIPTGVQANLDGTCPAMSNPEFPPVHNLHIGILSSSLGSRLGDACKTDVVDDTLALANGMSAPRHNDDQAHLIDRTADPNNLTDYTEGTLGAAEPDKFLNWFPPASVNPLNAMSTPTGPIPVTDPTVLKSDFQQVVAGVHQFGCGIESQLESWYRFLIQPDPYASLAFDSTGQYAQWQGIDKTLLAQRADFLRPDSLVAILVLSDENDSEVDVRSFGGTGWAFMKSSFTPPRGTSACASNPNDPSCTSCGFQGHESDPQCMIPPAADCAPGSKNGVYCSPNDWGFDLNLRHVHEKQKYGASVQFPIERYVLGLSSSKVPDRDHEYPPAKTSSGYMSSYQGLLTQNLNCTNPLFAAKLPAPPAGSDPSNWNPDPVNDLCNLAPGSRPHDLVFYAHIGGVPHELLQNDPSMPDAMSQSQKDKLADADWVRILGNDPENFDYSGIDPHMVESYQPRTGAMMPVNGFKVAAASQPEGTDPVAGREWETDSTQPAHRGQNVDREYACVFKLTDDTGKATPRDCSDASVTANPALGESCDCQSPASGTLTHAELPAVCNDANPTQQDSAKAYPTIRELLLARLLGKVDGSNEGIVSSLCPIHTTPNTADGKADPLYGYRPAMNAIVNSLSHQLATACLPERLPVTFDPTTQKPGVPCLVLGTFPSGPGAPTDCASVPGGGYVNVDPTVLAHFQQDQHAAWAAGDPTAVDLSTELTCALSQLPLNERCDKQTSAQGWCYVADGSVMGCAQALLFSPNANRLGVHTSLQCLEATSGQSGTVSGTGDGGP